jgi:hypothetical protein
MSIATILKILLGTGLLATIYQIYYHIVQTIQEAKNLAQDKKLQADQESVEKDKLDVTKADDALKSAIDKFDHDNS